MYRFLLIIAILAGTALRAQTYELKPAGEIANDLAKLAKGVRVMYIAAHPDDENTRLIAWLEQNQHIETAYLSLTRGQGGQNLIGPEKGDALGVIRTYELLEARAIDGGEQMFTRAVDFGYSKSADESFEIWNKHEVLSDVVRAIRTFRPHIIITRFPATKYAGHGHHAASAILASEAFDLAADPDAFTDQVKSLGTWRCEALYHNTSNWWRKELDEMSNEQLLEENIIRVDVGVYNPMLGLTTNEIASLARSQHRCQAFGTARDRGQRFEYLEFVKGKFSEDPFAMNGVWNRSIEHKQAIEQCWQNFDFRDMDANLERINGVIEPKFSQRSMWADARDIRWAKAKLNDIKRNLMALRVEAFTDNRLFVENEQLSVTVQVYNGGNAERTVRFSEPLDTVLRVKPGQEISIKGKMPHYGITTPFWLRHSHGWLYRIDDARLVNAAIAPQPEVIFAIDGIQGEMRTPVHRKWVDRSVGEIVQPLLVAPPVTITPAIKTLISVNKKPAMVKLHLKANRSIESGVITAVMPQGWFVKGLPSEPIRIDSGQKTELTLWLAPGENATDGEALFRLRINEKWHELGEQAIRYTHLPEITIYAPSSVKLSSLELNYNPGLRVAYIEGSGDEVDESLELLGYDVVRLEPDQISAGLLSGFDVLIAGIRAFNTHHELAVHLPAMHEFVKNGGKMIVQYNTTYDLVDGGFSPYPMEISRNRVTDENATPKFLEKKHPVLISQTKSPMKILQVGCRSGDCILHQIGVMNLYRSSLGMTREKKNSSEGCWWRITAEVHLFIPEFRFSGNCLLALRVHINSG
ncbi:MAG: hypothetical protein Kow0075_05200 [Salibacteraceae bacterium]